jgi:hypothetical protein
MDGGSPARELRLMVLSAATVVVAPLVFVSIIVLRKIGLRVHVKTRHWGKRLQHERARWT